MIPSYLMHTLHHLGDQGKCFAYTTRIAWCCLFSYFISELSWDGLWACPQLSSYSWWDCEYIMYHCWQNYTFNFWEKLMYVSYTTDQPGSSVGHPTCALAFICLWVHWHGWLSLIGCFDKMTLLLESFTHPMCMPICWTGHFNSCMFMINYLLLYHQAVW
jgi:hypothetical protein